MEQWVIVKRTKSTGRKMWKANQNHPRCTGEWTSIPEVARRFDSEEAALDMAGPWMWERSRNPTKDVYVVKAP
jgi:hypothetical protein